MEIMNYVKPELLVLAVILYLIGMMLKKTPKVADWGIPYILTGISVVLAIIYVLATADIVSYKDGLMAAFTAIVQGILCAGLAVYGNQLLKQVTEKNNVHE